jgi:hypothetical protein
MFCHITQNWRGRPLTDRLAVVELIGATTTKDRPESRKRPRYPQLPEGHQGQRSRNEMPRHHRRPVPSRMELHNQATAPRKLVAVIVRSVLTGRVHVAAHAMARGVARPGDPSVSEG